MHTIFNISSIAFTVLGYDVSYIELIGTLAGLLSVWFGTKNHILYWYIGLVNVLSFLVIFFQLQLYADTLLQGIYLCITVYGIISWRREKQETLITNLTLRESGLWIAFSAILLVFFYHFATNLNLFFPYASIKSASFALLDSTLSAFSVTATILIAKRKIEAWLIWIAVDFASVLLYLQKSVLFIAIEYGIFALLAVQGYVLWRRMTQKP